MHLTERLNTRRAAQGHTVAREANGRFAHQHRAEAQLKDLLPDLMAAGEAYRRGVEETVRMAGGVTVKARAEFDRLSRVHEDRVHRLLTDFSDRAAGTPDAHAFAKAGYQSAAPLTERLDAVKAAGEQVEQASEPGLTGRLNRTVVEPVRAASARGSVDSWKAADQTSPTGPGVWLACGRMQAAGANILFNIREQNTYLTSSDRRKVEELRACLSDMRGAPSYDPYAARRLAAAITDVTDRPGAHNR